MGGAPTQAEHRDGEDLVRRAEDLLAAGDFARAVPLLHAAEQAGAEPDRCAGNRWFAHMLQGDFEAAWVEGDAIRGRGAPDPHRFWNGEDLRGRRVILRSLHGFGDAVQMFRFLPRLQAVAAHVIVEVPPRLVELAPHFDGMGEVITWGEQAPSEPPQWDVQLEVMELPYVLRVNAADLAPTHGYLHLPEAARASARRVLGERQRPRVGVTWASGHWNPSRSVPFNLIEELVRGEDAEFWSLQGGHERLGSDAAAGAGWRDVYELGDGILALAAVVEQMDLVITVDTLTAHLAGALGVPCWLLLQQCADWRWMCGRVDSPWYPSVRLWRQSEQGDWAELMERVKDALAGWAPGPCGAGRPGPGGAGHGC